MPVLRRAFLFVPPVGELWTMLKKVNLPILYACHNVLELAERDKARPL